MGVWGVSTGFLFDGTRCGKKHNVSLLYQYNETASLHRREVRRTQAQPVVLERHFVPAVSDWSIFQVGILIGGKSLVDNCRHLES